MAQIPNYYQLISEKLDRIEAALIDLHRPSRPLPETNEIAPILSAKQVKGMTGWPDGTFYAKVAQMPEDVVIRGKSKRLLFDREKFLAWLKEPVQP